METEILKDELLDRIPRHANGRLKGGEESKRLIRLLNSYRFDALEMKMLKVEVDHLVEHYGHPGQFILKKHRRKPMMSGL